MMYEYKARVVRWIDGDTVEMDVDLGFHVGTRQTFRCLGYDTPERGQANYAEARVCANGVYPPGTELVIASTKSEKYGRWLVDLPAVREAITSAGLLKVAP